MTLVTTYYAMYGHPNRRRWEDGRRYGFIAAGGGKRWSAPLRRLQPGDELLVHLPGAGYVGHGDVTAPAVPIRNIVVDVDGQSTPLLDLPLVSPGLAWDADDDVNCEYVVLVNWRKSVSEREAYWRPGLFFRRTTVWPFEDSAQAEEIRQQL